MAKMNEGITSTLQSGAVLQSPAASTRGMHELLRALASDKWVAESPGGRTLSQYADADDECRLLALKIRRLRAVRVHNRNVNALSSMSSAEYLAVQHRWLNALRYRLAVRDQLREQCTTLVLDFVEAI